MDISGGVTNIDEYVNLLFTDFCALDMASCADISEVKIVIIEEDEEEAMREAELGIKAAAEHKEAEAADEGTTSATDASTTEEVISFAPQYAPKIFKKRKNLFYDKKP